MQRALALIFVCLSLATASIHGAGVALQKVVPEYRTSASFERISEYFSGKEDTGRISVYRSQENERDGFYWLARVINPGPAIIGGKVEIAVIHPGAHEAKIFVFNADIPEGSKALQFGLTGADWPGADVRPVAWRVTVMAADGAVMAVEKSFLWEVPSK